MRPFSDFRDEPERCRPVADDEELRLELTIACRALFLSGLSEGVAGHLTARSAERTDAFWVTPFGLDFAEVQPDDLVLVDHSGAQLDGDRAVNTAAFLIHAAVHAARSDIMSVAHTHGLHGRTFAAFGEPLRPINQNACAFYDDLAVHRDYAGPVLHEDKVRSIADCLGNRKAAILQHHGLLTVGATVEEATWWMIALERGCQSELLARAAGDCPAIPGQVAAETARNVGTPRAALSQYQPLRRRALALVKETSA